MDMDMIIRTDTIGTQPTIIEGITETTDMIGIHQIITDEDPDTMDIVMRLSYSTG